MKIRTRVEFQGQQRDFVIPCGTGDKTIKWLGIVASQRFSNAAPNGALRRRDDFCGITEKAQYQVDSIILPNGRVAHPGRYINESDLKDGDEVLVRLSADLLIISKNGIPHQSQWASIAFNTSELTFNADLASMQSGGDADNEDDDSEFVVAGSYNDILESKDNRRQLKANADFMKIVLQSQMIDLLTATKFMEDSWAKIDGTIPRLKQDEIPQLKEVLVRYWDILIELYGCFSSTGTMNHDQFLEFTGEAGFFPAYTSAHLSSKIFTRACRYVGVDDESFTFSHLLVALMLVAQVKYNDTLESKAVSVAPREALLALMKDHLIPLAVKSQLQSILKSEFCSDETLSSIRLVYDELQNIFTKYAAKIRDVPTTVPLEDISEILTMADLVTDPDALGQTRQFLYSVRQGTIFGNALLADTQQATAPESLVQESTEDGCSLADYVNEVAFPEFVEMAARAGYSRFYEAERQQPSNAPESDGQHMIARCLVKGVKAVVEGNNSNEERLRNKAAAPTRGGRSQNQRK